MTFIPANLDFKDLQTRSRTSRIVVHHSASADVSAAEIHRWHRARGWSGIGYHYVIRKNGNIELGRPVDTVGAHTSGYNSTSIGICLTGNFMEETPSAEQLRALVGLIRYLEQQYGQLEINRHQDLSPTACPGDKFPWKQFIQTLNEPPAPPSDEWKKNIIKQARERGLITADHAPDDPAPKWFVLAVALNLLSK